MTLFVARILAHLKGTFAREPWWAELWAATAALLWASWVGLTGSDLTHGAAYSMILKIAGEEFWVYSGLLLGLTHISVVLADRKLTRRLTCAIASAWWSTLFLSMLIMVPRAPGLALFFVMALINMVSATRTLRQPV